MANFVSAAVQLPRLLACQDAVIQTTLVSLAQGMSAGLPDLYAETAAEFLSAHLLLHHCGTIAGPEHDDRRLRRVDDYLRDHLDKEVSLEDLATHASLSRFHLLRLYKRKYGETPLKRLTRFRMAEAKRHLQHGQLSIAQIATRCGYDNPAHFASAFRRVEGVPPTAFRKR